MKGKWHVEKRGVRVLIPSVVRRLGRGLRRHQLESTLLVPVPSADQLRNAVIGQRSHDRRLPPHITVVYPFMPPERIDATTEAEIARLFARLSPFRFRLDRVERFPGGVTYLAPEPSAPFVDLALSVCGRWPRYPPYGGAFPAIVPHLTVGYPEEPVEDLEGLKQALPIEGEATEVWLLTLAPGARWSVRRRFPLGSPGGSSMLAEDRAES